MWIRAMLGGARTRLVAAIMTLAAAAAGCTCLPSAALASAVGPPNLDPQELALCQQINAYRASHGLAALRVSRALTRAAGWMSLDMASHDTFDHIDSRGRDFNRRIRAFGYRGMTMAENLVGGTGDAAASFRQLRASPAHRKNLLRAKLTMVGIGRAYAADTMLGWYWSTTYGARRERGAAC